MSEHHLCEGVKDVPQRSCIEFFALVLILLHAIFKRATVNFFFPVVIILFCTLVLMTAV